MLFLARYKDQITSAGSIVAIAAAIIGLFFTGYQIRENTKATQLTRLYQIQTDGRRLLSSFDDNMVRTYLFSGYPVPKASRETIENTNFKIRQVVQFYSSVYNQRVSDLIPAEFWSVFLMDICGFALLPRVQEYWAENVKKGAFSDGFKRIPSTCE